MTEQAGTVRIVQDRSVLGPPFLDISSRVTCCGETGLLGLAFHPNYSANGYFFVSYTYVTDANTLRLRVSRFKVSAEDANLADANSEFVILEIDKPYATHNGGSLQFGPDGYLYISTGDGGGMYDPMNNAQNMGALLGRSCAST